MVWLKTKGTLWEGGIRSPSFIWSASLQQNPRVSTNLMHVSDWLPTLYAAAGSKMLMLHGEKQRYFNVIDLHRLHAVINSFTGVFRRKSFGFANKLRRS